MKAGLVGLDGRLIAITRAGYGLEVGHGPGWAEQDPGSWWSAVVGAVRALHRSEVADDVEIVAIGVDGHGPTLAAVDARGEATRPAITFLDTRSAAEAAELEAATGVRGWGLGPLPAALWMERHEPAAAAATHWYLTTWEWLAFRLTGEAVASLVAHQVTPDAGKAAAATGLRVDRRPPDGAMGAIVGRLTETAADALGLQAGIPVAGGTNDAFASYLGAGLLEPGDAYDPGGSAGGFGVYWHEPVEVPGAFVSPAPLDGRYSVGAAMAATGRALDWFRDDVIDGATTTERLIEEAAAIAARRRWPRLPAVPRRGAIADLGPGRDRRARRAHAGPRSCPHHPRDHGGERARPPARGDADARGGRDGHRDAGLRRPRPERSLEPDQGRRHGVPGPRPGRAGDGGPRLGDARGGRDRGAARPARRRSVR